MFSIQASVLALSAIGALAVPSSTPSQEDGWKMMRRSVTPSSQGMNNGFFYSMWSDGTGNVQYNNGNAGEYTLNWSNSGDVVVGKGFNPGAPRNITYTADYQPDGISFLSVYGWFTDPLTEYYICENWGTGNPAGGDGMIHKGSFESDGSTYDVYQHQQVNAPSIQGTTNFMQYWSIRQEKRLSGTISTGNHYNYWKSIGLPIGTFDYQILATEGVKSSGKSTVTVSEGGSDAESNPGPSSASAAVAPPSSSLKPISSAAAAASSYGTAAGASSSVPTVASASLAPVAPPASESTSEAPSSAPLPPSTLSAAASPTIKASPSSSPAIVSLPSIASAAGGLPPFGGQASGAGAPSSSCTEHHTPGAGFPFGGRGGVRHHHTPGATPTPRFGRHGHHGSGHLHHGGGAYEGGSKPNAAGASSASHY